MLIKLGQYRLQKHCWRMKKGNEKKNQISRELGRNQICKCDEKEYPFFPCIASICVQYHHVAVCVQFFRSLQEAFEFRISPRPTACSRLFSVQWLAHLHNIWSESSMRRRRVVHPSCIIHNDQRKPLSQWSIYYLYSTFAAFRKVLWKRI